MPRGSRVISVTGIYHIILRGSGKQIIFEEDEDRKLFLATLVKLSREQDVKIIAWCLMSNHIHLLLQVGEHPGLFMKRLNTSYAKFFNEKYERVGHFFQDRFKSEVVEDEAYLTTVVRYIHQNPVKDGLCESCAEYPWSSYYEYVTRPKTCETAEVLDLFGGLRSFERAHKTMVSMEEKPSRSRTRSLSDGELIKEVEQTLGKNAVLQIREMKKEERNSTLTKMRKMGLSIRRIQRLTGIGFGVIAYATREMQENS